ncbi:type III-A CRISPR-associated protein Csm2 [Cruoricaptor ignavus]|nr:type III-A CRISPR-associated protein Csm2 [Cruoricaptor ignavus]
MTEMANDVKTKYFSQTFDNLLKLGDSEKAKDMDIDKTFKDIEGFIEYTYATNNPNRKQESITTHQLRNVFSKIVGVKEVSELKMIRPNLAYISARQSNKKAKEFMSFVDLLIQNVNSKEQLESFKKTMEAFVAYHKFHK